MPEIIKMNYDDMKNMANIFRMGSQTLENTIKAMNQVITLLNEGAMKGKPGKALTSAIRDNLNPRIKSLSSKFLELSNDILIAQRAMEQNDSSASGAFVGD